ncbi:uncharacterized protein Pyn_33507 [Prunus yedoensis var. nudiflora]|uniref:Protein downstream neighbor of Son n=1 Tax=Prunus yedoensis var. nudiflora TaxID=2094558 RepID=A0A314UHF6_PRUYE|nr:uncharacterized protein Pyn_33507 [Prunus yedoensis var. nudiflora]
MAKVAPPGSLPSTSMKIGGGTLKAGATVKRKTPSELRGEQRMNAMEISDESPAPLLGSTSEVENGLRKPELFRNPRYTDIRMDEVYAAKKSRFRTLSGKENAKGSISVEQPSSLKNVSVVSSLVSKRKHQNFSPENVASDKNTENGMAQAFQTIGKCSQSTFRSVTELSSGGDRLSGFAAVDVDKALKGMAAHESSVATGLPAYSLKDAGILHQLVQATFAYLVQRIHRSVTCGSYTTMPYLKFQSNSYEDQNRSHSSGLTSTSQVISSKLLHSWVYPQSTLPPSLIQVLTSSTAEGAEMEFLRKRQVAWEDSFQSLYYMLRNGICNIFYVCTPYFVVMFTGSDVAGGSKRFNNAYISQSTGALRSLLREHDVCFSMPLCRSKVEQVAQEVLIELSEMEKQNFSQTRRSSSLSDIDNTPESLLVFSGNTNVHGLFDILLNYRSFLTVLMGIDVPVLYSPVPFQNAAISSPEVKCMELKRPDLIVAPNKGSIINDDGSIKSSSAGLCSSVEIKDAYLPPWIICSLCAIMGSEGKSFEASFMNEPTSNGLNVAIEAVPEKSDCQDAAAEDLQESTYAFGIPEATVTPYLRMGLLETLKFSNGSYSGSLSPALEAD